FLLPARNVCALNFTAHNPGNFSKRISVCCFPLFFQKVINDLIRVYLPHLPSMAGSARINADPTLKASVMI
ncbi:hypothetical protein, partial [Cronobacter dublinensis]|uniref:hypothetical protein n=1 Tax=Cronobacter dublinensis TaxID=413497 RepID=UPI0024AE05AF